MPVHTAAVSKNHHVVICAYLFDFLLFPNATKWQLVHTCSHYCYVPAWRFSFECLQCPSAIIWQPVFTCLHACLAPILPCGTHLHTIHVQGPACGSMGMPVCLHTCFIPKLSLGIDLGYISVCILVVYQSKSPNNDLDMPVHMRLCPRGKTWQLEHVSLKTYSVPAPPYGYRFTCLPCPRVIVLNLICLYSHLPHDSAVIC